MDNNKPDILLVEDEESISVMVSYNLEKSGFNVRIAKNGESALDMVEDKKPDLIILDWMLPKLSGIDVCKYLRNEPETRHIPVIILTARGEEKDKLKGLDVGADDYIVKPFSPKELIARIHAVLRRARPSLETNIIEYAGLKADLDGLTLTYSNKANKLYEIKLGPTEHRLVFFLMEHPEKVFSREDLLDEVWGEDSYHEPRTVDVAIRRLRMAFDKSFDSLSNMIQTVRGSGYKLTKL